MPGGHEEKADPPPLKPLRPITTEQVQYAVRRSTSAAGMASPAEVSVWANSGLDELTIRTGIAASPEGRAII